MAIPTSIPKVEPIKFNVDFNVIATYGNYNDKVRDAVAQINNIVAYNFEFKQADETIQFFKDFKLTDYGAKVGAEPPEFIYSIVKKGAIDKLYDYFIDILKRAFQYENLSQEQLFKLLLTGIKLKSYDSEIESLISKRSKDFNLDSLFDLVINEIFKNPSLIGIKEPKPKLLGLVPQENDFYTNKIKINQKILKEYLIDNPNKKIIDLSFPNLVMPYINGNSDFDDKNILDYLKLVSDEFKGLLNFLLKPGDKFNPSLTYQKFCKGAYSTGNTTTCNYLANTKGEPLDGENLNSLLALQNNILNFTK